MPLKAPAVVAEVVTAAVAALLLLLLLLLALSELLLRATALAEALVAVFCRTALLLPRRHHQR